MADKRVLLIGGVHQTPGRFELASPLMVEICDEFEPELLANKYVANAPFDTISLIYRFGEEDVFDPEIGNVNKHHNELPVAISFQLARLTQMDRATLREEVRLATIEVLCDVSANFDLPFEFLDRMRIRT